MRIQDKQLNIRITQSLMQRINRLVDKLKHKNSRVTKTDVVVDAIEDKLKKEEI